MKNGADSLRSAGKPALAHHDIEFRQQLLRKRQANPAYGLTFFLPFARGRFGAALHLGLPTERGIVLVLIPVLRFGYFVVTGEGGCDWLILSMRRGGGC